jgi:hypothetical protein
MKKQEKTGKNRNFLSFESNINLFETAPVNEIIE